MGHDDNKIKIVSIARESSCAAVSRVRLARATETYVKWAPGRDRYAVCTAQLGAGIIAFAARASHRRRRRR